MHTSYNPIFCVEEYTFVQKYLVQGKKWRWEFRCYTKRKMVCSSQVGAFKYYPINRGFKPDYITAYKCECIAPDQGESSNYFFKLFYVNILFNFIFCYCWGGVDMAMTRFRLQK